MQHAGWIRMIIVLIALPATLGPLLPIVYMELAQNDLFTLVAAAIFASIIVPIQGFRRDAPFLRQLGFSPWMVFGTEYLIIGLCLSVLPISEGDWTVLIAIPLVSYAVALTKPRLKRRMGNAPFTIPFPATDIEWRSGFRRSFWVVFAVMILALMSAYVNFAAGVAFMLISTSVTVSFYRECESGELTRLMASSPHRLLIKKAGRSLLYTLLLNLPIMTTMIIASPEAFGPALLFWALASLPAFLAPVSKYAFYAEGMKIELPIMVIFAIAVSSLISGYLAPVVVFLGIWLWIRGARRVEVLIYA